MTGTVMTIMLMTSLEMRRIYWALLAAVHPDRPATMQLLNWLHKTLLAAAHPGRPATMQFFRALLAVARVGRPAVM
jgi:hypothetical protein